MEVKPGAKAFRLKLVSKELLTGEQKSYLADLLIEGSYTLSELSTITGIDKPLLSSWKYKRE